MAIKTKKLSNPGSTGGIGHNFENHVQASFVTLMLTGGYAPCLPTWPIVKIKLQGKIDGYDTDDFIAFVQNPNGGEQRKLLGQIKHSVSITKKDPTFANVIQAAWNDFNNPKFFSKNKDVICLITGPLDTKDSDVAWLLNHARAMAGDFDNYFRDISTAYFSSAIKREKLEVLKHHLKVANGGIELENQSIYEFLRHFYLLGYDLGEEEGVVLSLINSHLSQFKVDDPKNLWGRIATYTATQNHHAGEIKKDTIPDDIKEFFELKQVQSIPSELTKPVSEVVDWASHEDAYILALLSLVGEWDEGSNADRKAIEDLIGIDYAEWEKKALRILHSQDSPLCVKNKIWRVNNRLALWKSVGSNVLDTHLEKFKSVASRVLSEKDPAFELLVEDRYAASIHKKVLSHSREIRKGIANGLAMLSANGDVCIFCSNSKSDQIVNAIVRGIFDNGDSVLWGSLNYELPLLAEASPVVFLSEIEKELRNGQGAFDLLYAEESSGFGGQNYMSGLLWALETLAWDDDYFSRVLLILADLASRDPGGQWSNRPINSMVTILLPWLPQTLASTDKRRHVVSVIKKDYPNVLWELITQLLPSHNGISTPTHKPKWRMVVPEEFESRVSYQEYWDEVSYYSFFAVEVAQDNPDKLSKLIEHAEKLNEEAFNKLIDALRSDKLALLPDSEKTGIWEQILFSVNKHKAYSDTRWALPQAKVEALDQVLHLLQPSGAVHKYRHLFIQSDHDLYTKREDWDGQQKILGNKRIDVVKEIYRLLGWEGVKNFMVQIESTHKLGYAISNLDEVNDEIIITDTLSTDDRKSIDFIDSYIRGKHNRLGYDWSDSIDKSNWSGVAIGRFYSHLPNNKETWDRVSQDLTQHEDSYWSIVNINPHEAGTDIEFAIDKLLELDRPFAVVNIMDWMRISGVKINTEKCVMALQKGLSSNEPDYVIDQYHISELIKLLQNSPDVSSEDLLQIEWNYLNLLNNYSGVKPTLLEFEMASNPSFFCEVIRKLYKSRNETAPKNEPTQEDQSTARRIWKLLYHWKHVPGVNREGNFEAASFTNWIDHVRQECASSGHLEVALIKVGEVLIHSPIDESGLWIHKTIAKELNQKNSDELRRGFNNGFYNARGSDWVDSTGKPELDLADSFESKADELEKEGFIRLSTSLKSLVQSYKKEADYIKNDNQESEE
jgi:hypothetical protein